MNTLTTVSKTEEIPFESSKQDFIPTKSSSLPTWRDYLELTKPKVVALMLITTVIGMRLASIDPIPLSLWISALLGIALSMGGAAAINHIVDRKIDLLMNRTAKRPIATGRIDNTKALVFAGALCLLSLLILEIFVNRLTAILTLSGMVGYAFIYTFYLKRATPQNIVIGGLAGALPPLLGWTAVTNEIHAHGLLLVLIIFVWTPPHFWALAIAKKAEYAKAKIPMLPVTHGEQFTKTSIWLYTWLLAAVSYLPFIAQMAGGFYLLSTTLLNGIFLFYAAQLKWFPKSKTAMQMFGYSIIYLFTLFIALLIDHLWL